VEWIVAGVGVCLVFVAGIFLGAMFAKSDYERQLKLLNDQHKGELSGLIRAMTATQDELRSRFERTESHAVALHSRLPGGGRGVREVRQP
jgi:hypothetical protein